MLWNLHTVFYFDSTEFSAEIVKKGFNLALIVTIMMTKRLRSQCSTKYQENDTESEQTQIFHYFTVHVGLNDI